MTGLLQRMGQGGEFTSLQSVDSLTHLEQLQLDKRTGRKWPGFQPCGSEAGMLQKCAYCSYSFLRQKLHGQSYCTSLALLVGGG